MPTPAAHSYASVLALHGLEAEVRLGVGEEERGTPQKVIIDVRIYLPSLPAGAHSDKAPFICYSKLAQKIHALCGAGQFRLIEYLTHEIHRLLRAELPVEAATWIKLRKPEIMLPYVEGGASYSFSDLHAQAVVIPE